MDNLPRSRIRGRTGIRSNGEYLDNNGDGTNSWGNTKAEDDSSDSDEKSNPDLSDTLRLHREMIREMKRKYRISASRLRRGKSQGNQYAYQVLLNDNFTSCSESLSFAFDQLSVATPNWSVVLPGSPDKRPGSIALSPSFVETVSPSFPKTVDESSSTGKEVSWKQECLDGQYDDEDFSRLFRREEEIHPKKPQSQEKSTLLAGVLEEVDEGNDDGQDEFFDSCEVDANDKEVVDEFFDCVPTPEKNDTNTSINTCRFITNENVEEDGHERSGIDQSEKIICSKIGPENMKKVHSKNFINCYSDNQSLQHEIAKATFDNNMDHLSFIENTDKNESDHYIDTYTTPLAIDTEVLSGNNTGHSIAENDEDKNDARPFQQDVQKDIFQIKDHALCIEIVDNEDESEHVVETCTTPKSIDKRKEEIGNSAFPSGLEHDEDNEDETFFDSFSDAESLQQEEEKNIFQKNVDDTSSIDEMDEGTGERNVDASAESQTIDTKKEPKRNNTYTCITEKDENGDLNESISQTPSVQHLDYTRLEYLSKAPLIIKTTVDKTFVEAHSKEQFFLNSIEKAGNKDLDVYSKIHSMQHSEEDLNHLTTIESSEDNQCKDLDVSRSKAGVSRHHERESNDIISDKLSMIKKETQIQVVSLSNPVTSESLDDTTSIQHQNPTKRKLNAGFVISDSDNCSPLRKTLHEKALTQGELSGGSDSYETNIVHDAQKEYISQETGRQEVGEDALNPELLADEDKQIIDDILDNFFEEFNSMETETETPANKSHPKPVEKSEETKNEDSTIQEGDNFQFNIYEESIRKRTKSQEVADLEEMMIEPISIFDENPDNISMVLINEPNSELSRFSGVPTPIKNEVKEIDDMLNDFMQEMAAIDDGDDKYDDYDQNCTEDEMSDSTPRIDFESYALPFEDSQNEMVHSPLPKLEGHISTPSLIDFPSDHSPVRPALRLGDSQSDFTSSPRAIANNDDYQHRDGLQIEYEEIPLPNLSFGSEMSKSNIETDFVLPSFTPPKESRSRITSPELNHSVRDDSGIFLSTNVEIDSTRPNDPVATKLSQDSSEEETDTGKNNIQDNSYVINFSQTSSEAINNLVSFQGKVDDCARQKNPVSTALSRGSLEDQTESIKRHTQYSLDASDISHKSSEGINTVFHFQASSDDSTRLNNPVATSLSQDSFRNGSDAAEIISTRSTSNANKSSKTINAVSPFQAISDGFTRPFDPVATSLSPDSFGNETNTAEESIKKANKFARELNEVIRPVAPSQVIRDGSSRPKNPVATALSQELMEDKTDGILMNIQIIPMDSDLENISRKASNLIAPLQAISDDTKRLENPVIIAFAQNERNKFEKEPRNLSNTGDIKNEAMELISPLQVISSISKRSTNPGAIALSQNVLEEETDDFEKGNRNNFIEASSELVNPALKQQINCETSARPMNPVASTLCQHVFENETDTVEKEIIGKGTQNISSTSDCVNKSGEAVNPTAQQEANCEISERPNNPVASTLSQHLLENEIDTVEKGTQNFSNTSDCVNKSGEAINPTIQQEANREISIRPNNSVASTLSQHLLENEIDTFGKGIIEKGTQNVSSTSGCVNKSGEIANPTTQQEANCEISERSNNPVASTLSQHLLEKEIGTVEKVIQNISSTSDCTNYLGEAVNPTTEQETNCEISARPINPVASPLSQHLLENETDTFEKGTQNVSSTSDCVNKSVETINPTTQQEANCEISERPINPVASTLSQHLLENEIDTVGKGNQNVSSTSDCVDKSVEAINPTTQQEANSEISARPINPVDSTLSQHLLEYETDTFEKGIIGKGTQNVSSASDCVNKSVEAVNPTTQQEANSEVSAIPINPGDSALSQNLPEKNISIQNTSKVIDCADKSSEINASFAPPQCLNNDSAIHEDAIVGVESDDDSSKDLPHFDQGSVSTISPFSLQSPKVKRIDVDSSSQLDLPVLLSYSCDSNSSPRKSPVKKNAPIDPDKSFRSIASPPPIPKKETTLTDVLGVSASKPKMKSTQNDAPIRSNPSKIPFSRTRERLEGSPSRQRRARSRAPSSPHRIETSRSPLFFDRGDGRSSTSDSTVRWYTSPGRSRSPATPLRTPDDKSNRPKNNSERLPPPGAVTNHDRSGVRSPGVKSSKRKETKRSSARSETTQSTITTYASPNRSTASSMRSPLRGFYSLSSPPRSPAVSLFSRMPKGARSAIRRLQKTNQNNQSFDEETKTDFLSTDTVRVCTNKFVYKIHPKIGPCDRCWALASEEEREIFKARGSHLRITKTRSGCDRTCSIFPPADEKSSPVRLCRRCFFATHQQGDGSCKLQVYRGKNKVRPPR